MVLLRLFASVRVAAGTGSVTVPGETVGEALSYTHLTLPTKA